MSGGASEGAGMKGDAVVRRARSVEGIVFTAILLAFTLVLLFATLGLHASSRTVPLAVGMPLALLLCYRLAREFTGVGGGGAADAGTKAVAASRPRGETGAILWVIALPLVSTILGFIAGPAAYVAVWARIRGGERMAVALAAGVATAIVIQLLFGGLLGVALPMGLPGMIR
jgi:hypothetical protein